MINFTMKVEKKLINICNNNKYGCRDYLGLTSLSVQTLSGDDYLGLIIYNFPLTTYCYYYYYSSAAAWRFKVSYFCTLTGNLYINDPDFGYYYYYVDYTYSWLLLALLNSYVPVMGIYCARCLAISAGVF